MILDIVKDTFQYIVVPICAIWGAIIGTYSIIYTSKRDKIDLFVTGSYVFPMYSTRKETEYEKFTVSVTNNSHREVPIEFIGLLVPTEEMYIAPGLLEDFTSFKNDDDGVSFIPNIKNSPEQPLQKRIFKRIKDMYSSIPNSESTNKDQSDTIRLKYGESEEVEFDYKLLKDYLNKFPKKVPRKVKPVCIDTLENAFYGSWMSID